MKEWRRKPVPGMIVRVPACPVTEGQDRGTVVEVRRINGDTRATMRTASGKRFAAVFRGGVWVLGWDRENA